MATLPLPPADPEHIRRVAFLGTPPIAVPTLSAMADAGYEIPLVISGPDRRRGRGRDKSPTAVKAAALDRGIAVSDDVEDLLSLHKTDPIDLAIVVAFGQIIRRHVLEEIPMVNIHFSALPRWRGAAPVERAILEGDTETAVGVMSIVEALDEGDIWASVAVPITPSDTLTGLWETMSQIGAELMIATMQAGFSNPTPQVGESLYAHKISTEDRRIDWNRNAEHIGRIVRVGGAWTQFNSERYKVHEVEIVEHSGTPGMIQDLIVGTGSGGVRLLSVQPAGKPRMDAQAWANGVQPDGASFDHEQSNG